MSGKQPSDLFIGSKHLTNRCGLVTVTDYKNAHDVGVVFDETGYSARVKACSIRSGKIHDRLARTASGVGFMGVGKFNTSNAHKASTRWRSMLQRCYDSKFHQKKPTYKDCSVDPVWHNFQNFAKWYESNKQEKHDAYEVDKDLLFFGNKVYSPDTCLIVPRWLNLLTVDAGGIRGEYPIGVSFSKLHGKFEAYCNDNAKRVHLGLHNCPNKAHEAWRKYKLYVAEKRKPEMDMIDKRIYPNVVNAINNAK